MLRLENIPPEQMPEVVRIASELYEQDKEQDAEAQQRQATVDAAAEVGLPEEYLHRAAAELHTRRIVQVQQRQRRRNSLLAVGGAALVLGTTGYFVTRPLVTTPPAAHRTEALRAAISPTFSATQWMIHANKGTKAKVDFVNEAAVIRIEQFVPDANRQFFANLNTFDAVKNLTGYRTVSFRVHGTLPQVRLYLENGNERWRSPALPVEGRERIVRLSFDQFEYQSRASRDMPWQKDSYRPPTTVENLSFKTGWYVNSANASGEVALSDLRFE